MKKFYRVEEVINNKVIKPGSVIYTAGNATTPQVLLNQFANDTSIAEVEMLSVLLLGDIAGIFSLS